jgi:hypothetical protein
MNTDYIKNNINKIPFKRLVFDSIIVGVILVIFAILLAAKGLPDQKDLIANSWPLFVYFTLAWMLLALYTFGWRYITSYGWLVKSFTFIFFNLILTFGYLEVLRRLILLLFYDVTFFAIENGPSVLIGNIGEFMWILMLIAAPTIVFVHEVRLHLKSKYTYKNIITKNFSLIAMSLIFLVFIYSFIKLLSASF